MSATLAGHVAPQSSGTGNAVIRLFTPSTTTEIMKACSPIGATGNFTIYGITPGTYDVGIKVGGYLSMLATSQVFTEGGTTTIDFGSELGGDITNNDWVQLNDENMTIANYGVKGTCYGYPGNWLMPQCPSPPPAGGACYGYVIS